MNLLHSHGINMFLIIPLIIVGGDWRGIDVDDLENYQITVILTFQADGSHDIFLWTFFRRNVYFHLKFLRAGGHLAEVAFQKAANSFLWHNHTHHTS